MLRDEKDYTVQGGIRNYSQGAENDIVDGVPRRWRSDPDHPECILAYITEEEAAHLAEVNLHNSSHTPGDGSGPSGIPSYNGYGRGDADEGGLGTGGTEGDAEAAGGYGGGSGDGGGSDTYKDGLTAAEYGDLMGWDQGNVYTRNLMEGTGPTGPGPSPAGNLFGGMFGPSPELSPMMAAEIQANQNIAAQRYAANLAKLNNVPYGGYAHQTGPQRFASVIAPGTFYSTKSGKTAWGAPSAGSLIGGAVGLMSPVPGGSLLGSRLGEQAQLAMGRPSPLGGHSSAVAYGSPPSDSGEPALLQTSFAPPAAPAAAPSVLDTPPAVKTPWARNRSWWEGNTFNVAPLTRLG